MATIENQASLAYRGTVTLSNIVRGEVTSSLTVSKTAVLSTYGAGDVVTYVVTLVNTGDGPVTATTVTDNLGAYAFGTGTLTPLDYVAGSVQYYVNGTLQAPPTVTQGDGVSFAPITVPAGGNATLVYAATLNSYAPLGDGATVTNAVTVSGGGVCETVFASATITADATPELTITKEMEPMALTCGDPVTYTLTVRNYGAAPVPATDNATVADTLTPPLTALLVTLDGAPLTEGTDYTYNEQTGDFTTLPGALPIPAATVTQDPVTGEFTVTPGVAVLTLSGTLAG
ncbi:MAG: hypothetical protein IJF73_01220 [Clostridia bacterium]|nr:hypothetical protein [Clostridia bacterium]